MDVLTLGIALFLTVISYLIFPIIYVKKNGKVSEKLGKKLALWNSIICALIFFILGFCIGLEPSTNSTMFAPAFFYYFIAKSILIDKTITNDKPISNNTKNSTNIVENNSYSICPKCGMQIFEGKEVLISFILNKMDKSLYIGLSIHLCIIHLVALGLDTLLPNK